MSFPVSQLEGVEWRVDYIVSSSLLKVNINSFYHFYFLEISSVRW